MPVLTEASEALGLARDGKPVRLHVHGEEAMGLAVRELLPRDGRVAWEVALGGHQLPGNLRGLLKQVHVEEGANPTDAEGGRKYDMPAFTSAASGGNGAATFWHGDRHVTEEVFFHEFGQVLGQAFSTTSDFVPDGWAAAREADGAGVSTYGDASLNEDFAEAFAIWMTVRNGQLPRVANPPASLLEFGQRFPARAAILQSIMRGERRPVER
ncbi:MAG: hypothetical protein VKS61_12040 [Candidatus Sericytochromatia bacterium]|nr:hypothetical protein [Candidatus Sericytochromatia bacterium]